MTRPRVAHRAAIAVTVLALTIWLATPAQAVSFGYFVGNASGTPAGAITAAGATPVLVADLSDLSGISALWILNGSNGGYGADVTANVASIAAFVQAGGVLSFHDRRVTEAATILPGAGGITFVHGFGTNIDIVTGGTPVTSGPGGVIGATTLDGGNYSNHGYATLASLPAGAVPIFSNGVEGQIVDFYYPFGAGTVYYSTIPLDFYLGGSGNNPPADAFRNIYAPNEAAFQAGEAGDLAPVPEPATIVLLGSALAGIGWKLRRRS